VNRRHVLITGASAGLGAAFARAYARAGASLVMTARRADRLERLAAELSAAYGTETLCIPADLADPGAVPLILERAGTGGRPVDILVNNAGYGLPGGWTQSDFPAQRAALEVMLTAPMHLCHACLPGMRARGFGRILNIASLAGLLPGGPGHTSYAAIKAALIRFSQSLAAECAGDGVRVLAVCPGLTYTEFHDVNATRASLAGLPRFLWQDADAVVAEAIAAAERPGAVRVTGRVNRLIAAASRLFPEGLLHKAASGVLARVRTDGQRPD